MSNAATIHPKTGNLVTPAGILLWNYLFNPNKKGKYEFNIGIPKDANIKVLLDAAWEEGMTTSKGNGKIAKAFKAAEKGKWPSGVKSPFKKSADYDRLAEIAADYPVYLAGRCKDRPGVVGPNGKSDGVEPQHAFHGANCKASLQVFAYDTDGNLGVTFGLVNVQLLGGGEEIVIGGGRVGAESEFEGVGEEASGESADKMFS